MTRLEPLFTFESQIVTCIMFETLLSVHSQTNHHLCSTVSCFEDFFHSARRPHFILLTLSSLSKPVIFQSLSEEETQRKATQARRAFCSTLATAGCWVKMRIPQLFGEWLLKVAEGCYVNVVRRGGGGDASDTSLCLLWSLAYCHGGCSLHGRCQLVLQTTISLCCTD